MKPSAEIAKSLGVTSVGVLPDASLHYVVGGVSFARHCTMTCAGGGVSGGCGPQFHRVLELLGCDALRAAGAKITREPGPVKFGTTVIAFVEDPDGYKIELIERA